MLLTFSLQAQIKMLVKSDLYYFLRISNQLQFRKKNLTYLLIN